jgi:hypothetical protein
VAKTLKFKNVLTCEHVVAGAMNKPTLIGVYSGDILVESFPAGITMGVFAEHISDPQQGGLLTLTLMLGKQTIGRMVAHAPDQQGGVGVIAIPFVPLQISENTRFKVIASCEGFKDKVIVDQKISVGKMPVAPN